MTVWGAVLLFGLFLFLLFIWSITRASSHNDRHSEQSDFPRAVPSVESPSALGRADLNRVGWSEWPEWPDDDSLRLLLRASRGQW